MGFDRPEPREFLIMAVPLRPFSFKEVVEAVEAVHERLLRAAGALDAAGVDYAVIGGNAVAAWVRRVDRAAVRNTQDVDILLRRTDFDAATAALATAGFIPRHVKGIDMFLDGPGAKARDAVHVIFANEKVRPDDPCPSPDVADSERAEAYQVLSLPALIRMKLTSFRRKDQVHLLDFIEVGLIDQSTVATVPPELAPRLQELIDNPES
jgi:hypothetical protein